MATIYNEQPGVNTEGTGVGLVAGLVLVLAVIALVFLATRAAPGSLNDNSGTIDVPSNGGAVQFEGGGSVQGGGSTGGTGTTP